MRQTSSAGGNSSSNVGAFVFSGLTTINVDAIFASKYAMVAQDVSTYIQNNPVLQRTILAWNMYDFGQGYKTAVQASTLMTNAEDLGLSFDGFRRIADGGVATMLSASVSMIDSIAKKNGVTLNPCALSISKLSLDFAGGLAAGGAAVALSFTGVGAAVASVLTVMQIYAAGSDAYSLGVYCIDPVIAAARSNQ